MVYVPCMFASLVKLVALDNLAHEAFRVHATVHGTAPNDLDDRAVSALQLARLARNRTFHCVFGVGWYSEECAAAEHKALHSAPKGCGFAWCGAAQGDACMCGVSS